MAKSSGESFAFLGMYFHSFSLHLGISSVEPNRRSLFSQGQVARTKRTVVKHRVVSASLGAKYCVTLTARTL